MNDPAANGCVIPDLGAAPRPDGPSLSDVETPVVIYLEPRSRSLSYRPYLDRLGSVAVLKWVVDRLRVYSGATTIIVLHHHAAEREALEEAADTPNVQIRHTPYFNKVRALADCAAILGAARILTMTIEASLLPADLGRRAVEHHLRTGNTYTLTKGLPAGCSLGVFDRAILSALDELALPAIINDPAEGVERLQFLAESTGEQLPFKLEHTAFDAIESYGLDPFKLPHEIRLSRRNELRAAERAIERAERQGCDPTSPAVAYELKELMIRESSAERPSPPWANRDRKLRPMNGKIERTRVLYVSSYSAFSGAEESLCSLIKSIDRGRFELYAVLCLEGMFAAKLRALGVTVTCLERDFPSTIPNFSHLLSVFERINPDLIHFNGSEGPVFLYAAFALGIPFVQHVRNGDMTGFEDGILSSSAVIAVSEFLRREALAFPAAPDKVSVIYDEVDPGEFKPGIFDKRTARTHLDIDPDAGVALMIARLAPNKRHDLMVKAASILRDRVPKFKLLLKSDVYGDSLTFERLRGLMRELELEQTVIWYDFVPDIRMALAAADVLVLCSEREGLGRCVVEAMSMEIPVVVTDSGGTHEIVESGISGGFVVPSGKSEPLASRIAEILLDGDLARALGQSGRRFVVQHLNASDSAKRVMSIYDTVTASG